jgi:RNA polymerase sporulation-specific sigma factor
VLRIRSRAVRSSAERAQCDRLDDEVLVQRAQAGDDMCLVALLDRYRVLAEATAQVVSIPGADAEDVVQEAMIAVYKAARRFDPRRGTAFGAFAEHCVTRQVVSVAESAARHKHRPLNSYVSYFRPIPPARQHDPVERVLGEERLRLLREHISVALSDLEVQVLDLYADGCTYGEIAEVTRRAPKAVDNALQRGKRKLQSSLPRERLA